MRRHFIGQGLRRAAGWVVLFALLAASVSSASATAATADKSGDETSVILMFSTPAETSAMLQASPKSATRTQRIETLTTRLKARASAAQEKALTRLEQMKGSGQVKRVQPFWITNAVAVTVQSSHLSELSSLPGVVSVTPDRPLHLVGATARQSQATSYIYTSNLEQVHAPEMWAQGFTGQGIVVANLDTGVNPNTDSLESKHRDLNYWYDVYGSTSPNDSLGHGTATMEIMVGDNFGVAPGAKWMAVKIFPDVGDASETAAIQGFQWLLAPNGDPASAPDVVNNSWAEPTTSNTCGDNAPMHAALQALVAANILPIFAAGNYDSTSLYPPPPSSYPEAFAVGAVDSSNAIAYFSVRGPASCRSSNSVFPDISAPGVNIPFYYPGTSTLASDLDNNGTSFAAPHVAGGLAVLMSAIPNLSIGQQRFALEAGAVDLGASGADNVYGFGRLDLLRSYYSLLNMQSFYLPVIAR